MLHENGLLLGFVQLAAQLSFLVLHLGADILGKFANDIVALRTRKELSDSLQVTIDQFHKRAFLYNVL
jgi:hypothetical protein